MGGVAFPSEIVVRTLEWVPQWNSHDCGPAAICTVLRAYGVAYDTAHVYALARPTHDGTPPGRMADTLCAYGLTCYMRSDMRLSDLRDCITLCPVQYHGIGHWVAVGDVSPSGVVWLTCPASGPQRVSGAAFLASWHDELNGLRLNRFGIEVQQCAY